ncbi:hypothetical protein FSP39_006846 [Pinctada imbricata]|uniref:Deoxynucleoside kinase domain-containing protein n=1 Tax=Pinctada imbricata TaxID=66713 RepID=A0AA88XXK0_PINIB|nr:hypothetical protein FSP39_006846 [Pinctada imbricata]
MASRFVIQSRALSLRRSLAVFVKSICANFIVRREAGGKNFPDSIFTTNMLGADQLRRLTAKVFDEEKLRNLLPKGKKSFMVSVEGNIGSGKTTLLEYFKNSPNVEAIREPVEQWTNIQGHNALKLLYENPSRWSFSFNLYAQLTRIQMHMKETEKPVKLLERSLHSTRFCFVENDFRKKTINELEYTILTQWFEHLTSKENTDLDLIVYLRADPSICYERIKKRSRKEEAGVPFELIKDLHELHEEWLVQQKYYKAPAPVLVSLDANCEYQRMTEVYDMKRQEILCGYV